MKIGELAKCLGVATSKIRFYESAGLLGEVPRKDNGFRSYDEQAIVTLSFIRDAQRAGMDLEAIRGLLRSTATAPKSERAQRALLKELQTRLGAVETLQQQLKRQKAELQSAIAQLQARLPMPTADPTRSSQQSLL